MNETDGDIWEYGSAHKVDALCVATNMTVASGRLIMGGGQARQAKQIFPDLPSLWGRAYEERQRTGFAPVLALYETKHFPFTVVSFPTKYHPSDNSSKDLIIQAAHELVDVMTFRGWDDVLLPRVGCGLGGLQWGEVREWLAPIFDDRITIITNV